MRSTWVKEVGVSALREKELSRVGGVAERLEVSPRTIRYYDELG